MHRRRKAILAALCAASLTAVDADGDSSSEAVDAAIAWIDSLPSNRIYTDGYHQASAPSLSSRRGQETMLPAAVLDFYRRAWVEFLDLPGLSERQRQPHHYKIGHEIEDRIVSVVIQGLLLPRIVAGEPTGYLRVSLGPSLRVRFVLDTGERIDSHLLK